MHSRVIVTFAPSSFIDLFTQHHSNRPAVVTLFSSDNEKLVIEVNVMKFSNLIGNAQDGLGETNKDISVHAAAVLECCSDHQNDHLPAPALEERRDTRKRTTNASEWDQKFNAVDQEMLVIIATNYLDIKNLFVVECETVANMIKSKSPEEICKFFSITKDSVDKEEEQIRRIASTIAARAPPYIPFCSFFVVILLRIAISINARAYQSIKHIHMKE